jgi:hypothetical protein
MSNAAGNSRRLRLRAYPEKVSGTVILDFQTPFPDRLLAFLAKPQAAKFAYFRCKYHQILAVPLDRVSQNIIK